MVNNDYNFKWVGLLTTNEQLTEDEYTQIE